MSYVFLFTFFSLPLIFTLIAASNSHFLSAATKFSCCSSSEKCLLCFLSRALALCRSFSRWAPLACRLLSLFPCLSPSLNSKFVDMTINLSLVLKTTRIQKQFPPTVFVFIRSLVLCFTRRRWLCYFPPKCLGCHTCWFMLLWYACGTDGRAVGLAATWSPKFLGWVDYHNFLGMGLR